MTSDREKILIVVNPDGFIEVFGESHVDVYIVEKLDAAGVKGENLAWEYLWLKLPWVYRKIFGPGSVRGWYMPVGEKKPSDENFRRWSVWGLKEMMKRETNPPPSHQLP